MGVPKNVQICLTINQDQAQALDRLLESWSLKAQKFSGVYVKFTRNDWIRSLITEKLRDIK